jgi:hypothetical protein
MGTDLCVHARFDFPSWCRSWGLVEAVGFAEQAKSRSRLAYGVGVAGGWADGLSRTALMPHLHHEPQRHLSSD